MAVAETPGRPLPDAPAEGETPEPEVVRLSLPVLQFCDLLSLHLCSNAPQPVEFPQDFGGGRVILRRQGSRVALSPSPLAAPVTITFHAFLAEPNRTVRRRRSVELQLS
jgi:hypothetical protein